MRILVCFVLPMWPSIVDPYHHSDRGDIGLEGDSYVCHCSVVRREFSTFAGHCVGMVAVTVNSSYSPLFAAVEKG